jgi:hypothetical protein
LTTAFGISQATTPRFRALLVAEGRLPSQWHDDLVVGAPGRGMPPLEPNCEVRVLQEDQEDRRVAGQLRQFDRDAGDRALVVLVGDGQLDRFPADLSSQRWHLLIADEALRYANPATEAHRGAAPGAPQRRRGLLAADRHAAQQVKRGACGTPFDVLRSAQCALR